MQRTQSKLQTPIFPEYAAFPSEMHARNDEWPLQHRPYLALKIAERFAVEAK
jgi:hypothetical protein